MLESIKHIVLVCNRKKDTGEKMCVKVREAIGAHCTVTHFPVLDEALAYVAEHRREVDAVMMDLRLAGPDSPQEVYRRMKDSAGELPIIVFACDEMADRDLALFAIEQGAADCLAMDDFDVDQTPTRRLREVVLFSVARCRLWCAERERHQSDVVHLRDQHALEMRHAVISAMKDLEAAEKRHQAELAALRDHEAELAKEKDQVINWLSGGYSVAPDDQRAA